MRRNLRLQARHYKFLETSLDCKSSILGPKMEELLSLVHRLFVILSALQYKSQRKMD